MNHAPSILATSACQSSAQLACPMRGLLAAVAAAALAVFVVRAQQVPLPTSAQFSQPTELQLVLPLWYPDGGLPALPLPGLMNEGMQLGTSLAYHTGTGVLAVGMPWFSYTPTNAQLNGGVGVYRKVAVAGVDAWVQQQVVVSDQALTGGILSGRYAQRFGQAVAMSADGTFLIVGAPLTIVTPTINSGAVYVFQALLGGVFTQTATMNLGAVAGAEFGTAIATHPTSNVFAVGAPAVAHGKSSSAVGEVYVYTHNGLTWSKSADIAPASVSSASKSKFGSSLAMTGDLLVVGAPGYAGAGAVFVFELAGGTWTERDLLTQATSGDLFGTAVAVDASGAMLLVGAPGASDKGSAAGAAVVFRHDGSGWLEDARLTAEGSDSGDRLGSSVALSDDGVTAVAGTNRASGAAGFVLVFEDRAGALGDTWEGVAALYEPDAASGEANAFGTAVALVGSTLLVGAPTATAFGVPSAGTAYVFEQSPGLSTSASMVTLNTTYVATSTPSVVFTPHTMVVGEAAHDLTGGMVLVYRRLSQAEAAASAGSPAFELVQHLRAPDTNTELGASVSVDGRVMACGAPKYAHTSTGAVFVYVDVASADGGSAEYWSHRATLVPAAAGSQSQVGQKVAVGRGGAVIVATTLKVKLGGVVVYYADNATHPWASTTWIEQQTLEPFVSGGKVATFGAMVIEWPLLLVSHTGCIDAGCVAVYDLDSAEGFAAPIQMLEGQAFTTTSTAQFGAGIALGTFADGTRLLAVGAPADNGVAAESGAVYVFRPDINGTWVLATRLSPGVDEALGLHLGSSVAVTRHGIVAGAPGAQAGRGAAFVFEPVERTDAGDSGVAALPAVEHMAADQRVLRWQRTARFAPTTVAQDHRFGASVSFDRYAGVVAVGTVGDRVVYTRVITDVPLADVSGISLGRSLQWAACVRQEAFTPIGACPSLALQPPSTPGGFVIPLTSSLAYSLSNQDVWEVGGSGGWELRSDLLVVGDAPPLPSDGVPVDMPTVMVNMLNLRDRSWVFRNLRFVSNPAIVPILPATVPDASTATAVASAGVLGGATGGLGGLGTGIVNAGAGVINVDGGLFQMSPSTSNVRGVLSGCLLQGGLARRGGALHVASGTLTLDRTRVTQCAASLGGALFAQQVCVCVFVCVAAAAACWGRLMRVSPPFLVSVACLFRTLWCCWLILLLIPTTPRTSTVAPRRSSLPPLLRWAHGSLATLRRVTAARCMLALAQGCS